MTRKNNGSARRLSFEPLEQRQMLDASWYCYVPAGSSVSADELEMWDWVNQFRGDPTGMLYKIFNDPQDLYRFDSLYQSHTPIAKDSEVDRALSAYVIQGASGDRLTAIVGNFLDQWYSIEAADPLTLSFRLCSAAAAHNSSIIRAGRFTHTDNLRGAIESTGFVFADDACDPTENIATGGKSARGDFSVSSYLFAEMAIDWGVGSLCHRDNLVDPSVTDLGVAVAQRTNSMGVVEEYFSTLNFAAGALPNGMAAADGAYLLGLIYRDITGDGVYTACRGEGLGPSDGYVITITDAAGESCVLNSLQTGLFQNGGYQIFLENGTYTVNISGGSFTEEGITREVTVSGGNVKLDFRVQDLAIEQPLLDLNGDDEGTGAQARFVEGSTSGARLIQDSEFLLTSGISAGDRANTLSRMTVSFQSRPDGANDMLGVTLPANSSIRLSQNTVTGELEVFGTASVDVYRDLLASLTYINLSEGQADLSDRVISIKVSNGVYTSDEAYVTVAVQPKDLPVLTIEDASVWEWENSSDSAAVRTLTFNLTLSEAARQEVTLRYRLSDGTAKGGINYRTADSLGTVTIAPGDTAASIDVVIYGDYDINDDLQFSLAIDSISGAIWDDKIVTAVIKDDDTPVARISGVTNWSSETFGSFERGGRHYLYTFTSETDGLVRWTAAGANLELSATAGWSQDAESVGTSQWKGGKETLQWYAEAGVEYYILLKGTFSYRNPTLEFIAVEQNNSIDVDPLVQDGRLDLRLADGALVLGSGDSAFTLPLDRLDPSQALKLNSSRNNILCNVLYGGGDSLGYNSGTGELSYGGTTLDLSDFTDYRFGGGNSRESLAVTGTDGNDLLVYGSGCGELTLGYDTENASTITFSGITRLDFDAGGGTGDIAVLTDTIMRDTARCDSAEAITLAGGGYTLTASHFNDVSFHSVNGRGDKFSVAGVDFSSLSAEPSSLRFQTPEVQGAPQDDPLSGNGADPPAPSGGAASHKFSVSGVRKIYVDASGASGTATVLGSSDRQVSYQATLGYIRAVDQTSGSVLEINNAKDLVLTGVDEEQVTLLDTDAQALTGQHAADNSSYTYTGTSVVYGSMRITLPVFATKRIISTADEEQQPAPAAETRAPNLCDEIWAREGELPPGGELLGGEVLESERLAELCAPANGDESHDGGFELLLEELNDF